MKGKKIMLLQLVDLDGENMGLIKTNIPEITIKQHWSKFVDEESTDVDDFVEYMEEFYPDNKIERIFVKIVEP